MRDSRPKLCPMAGRRRRSSSSTSRSCGRGTRRRSRSRGRRRDRSASSSPHRRHTKKPTSRGNVFATQLPPAAAAARTAALAAAAAEAAAPKRGASGIDFTQVRELKQKIEMDKETVMQDLIQARRAHDEQCETGDAQAARECEYFTGPTGSTCGPAGRFVVREELGRGVFSSVFRCEDTEADGLQYAVKFTRANAVLRKATEREVRLLGRICTLAAEDPEGSRCLLGLVFFEGFEHSGHLAVVLELMKCDLRIALKKYGHGRGLPLLPTVRNFGKNVFCGLRALRRAEVIHCDIKPENLLLSHDGQMVKLSDFGSAMAADEHIRTDYLQPRFYRAPEVILGHRYDAQIDIWSASATLFELAVDSVLFRAGSNNAMLHEMLKVCGPFELSFSRSGVFSSKHFKDNGDFLNASADFSVKSTSPPVIPMAAFSSPPRSLPRLLEEALKEPPKGVPGPRHQGLVAHFVDLLAKGLTPNPLDRATPQSALGHKFFEKGA